jgi:hypothetical protein
MRHCETYRYFTILKYWSTEPTKKNKEHSKRSSLKMQKKFHNENRYETYLSLQITSVSHSHRSLQKN